MTDEHIPKTEYSQEMEQAKMNIVVKYIKSIIEKKLAERRLEAEGEGGESRPEWLDETQTVISSFALLRMTSQDLWDGWGKFVEEGNYVRQAEGFSKCKFFNKIGPRVSESVLSTARGLDIHTVAPATARPTRALTHSLLHLHVSRTIAGYGLAGGRLLPYRLEG